MLWVKSASKAISDAFYDKQFALATDTIVKDAEGGISRKRGPKFTYNGNVRFSNLGEVQEELGLTESIDIVITCNPNVPANLNDRLFYEDKEYVVSSVVPSDSHLTITGRK